MLFGRVLRGKTAKDFETLSCDPNRRVVFVFGSDFIEKAANLSGKDILRLIGYTENYSAKLIAEGTQFQLVTFEGDPTDYPVATWAAVENLVAQAYPEIKIKDQAFYYDIVHVRELFTGLGYTKLATGEVGVREYVGLNQKLSGLKNVTKKALVVQS